MSKFRRAVETVLVTSGNQAVVADGATALTDASGNCNLASGQLGIFGVDPSKGSTYTAITVGDTPTDHNAIEIGLGTEFANLPGQSTYQGFFNKTHLLSHRIYGALTRVWRGTAYVAPRRNAWILGAIPGSADAIGTPLDETEYGIRVTFRSRRHEEAYSHSTRDSIVVKYTTPDYTTLGTTNPLDHLIQNLVYELNKNSRAVITNGRRGSKDFVAYAVRMDVAGAGAATDTDAVLVSALDALAGATAYPTSYGRSTDAETGTGNANSQEGAAWVALAADTDNDLATTDQVVDVDLTLAGTNALGVNSIVIMSLESATAYDDRIPQTQVDLEVSKAAGFGSAVGLYDSSAMAESSLGAPRKLKIFFNNTTGQRLYSQNRDMLPIVEVIPVDNYISSTGIYDVYLIESEAPFESAAYQPDNARVSRTYIFVPSASTTTKNQLEAALNPYFAAAGHAAVNI